MRRGIVAAIVTASIQLIGARAEAQRVTGVIREQDTGGTVPGVVVTVVNAAGELVVRGLSDGAGHFVLPRATGTEIRLLRLGFRPQRVALPASADELLTLDVTLVRVPTLLDAVPVVGNTVCPRSADGEVAAGLWQQARAALEASVVARSTLPAVATNLTYDRVLRPESGEVALQNARSTTGRTGRPFRAPRPASELSRAGYVQSLGTERQFDVPDADVLLDDSFAATHCFEVRQGEASHAGEIGLAFAPAPGHDTVVDVRGVLWLATAPAALRTIEYRYTGLTIPEEREGAGGEIHFRSLSNGVVVVSSWMLRLAVIEDARIVRRGAIRIGRGGTTPSSSRDSVTYRVAQRRETGGVLTRAVWPDSVVWTAPITTMTGRVISPRSGAPIAGALISVVGTSLATTSGIDGRFVLRTWLPGRYLVRASDTTMAFALGARIAEEHFSAALDDSANVTLEMPTAAQAVAAACRAMVGAELPTHDGVDTTSNRKMAPLVGRVLLPPELTAAGLTLAARWQDYVPARINPETRVPFNDSWTTTLDDDGRFTFCNVARDRVVLLNLSKNGVALADTLVRLDLDSPLGVADWHPPITARALAEAAPAALRGVARRAADGRGFAGVTVWLPALDRRTVTDSTGGFRFDSLPGGMQLVQVRQIGFIAQRDTVTLVRGQEVRRDFALMAQGTLLDTVRTVAERTQGGTPALRGFESRRALGIGRFISGADLRAQESSSLATTLSRVPGVTLIPAPFGGSYLISTRKGCAGSALRGPCQPCFVSVYLDGVKLYDASNPGATPPDMSSFQNAELAGVELYGGGASAPAEYNATGSGCGTMLLWTRDS